MKDWDYSAFYLDSERPSPGAEYYAAASKSKSKQNIIKTYYGKLKANGGIFTKLNSTRKLKSIRGAKAVHDNHQP